MLKSIKPFLLMSIMATAFLFMPIKAEAIASSTDWRAYARETGYYYEQLTSSEKKIYWTYVDVVTETKKLRYINDEVMKKLKINPKDPGFDSLDFATKIEKVRQIFEDDHPGLISTVPSLQTGFSADENFMDEAKSAAVLRTAKKIVSSRKKNTVHDSARAYHDYLCETVSYSYASDHQTAYGALIDKECVCNGYAHAFQLLCNMSGIECVIQYGNMYSYHAWNQLVLEDGQWYEVDVTADDAGSHSRYTYLFKTTKIMNANNHIHFTKAEADRHEGFVIFPQFYLGYDPPVSYGTRFDYEKTLNGSGNTTINSTDSTKRRSLIGKTFRAASGEKVKIISHNNAGIVKGKSGATSVPSSVTVDGLSFKVSWIEKNAYRGNRNLTRISIGKDVTYIGSNAFDGCQNLKSITIKSCSLKSIGAKAFRNIDKNVVFRLPKPVFSELKKKIIRSEAVRNAKFKKS